VQQQIVPVSGIQQSSATVLKPIGSLSSLNQPTSGIGYQFLPTTYTAAPEQSTPKPAEPTYTASTSGSTATKTSSTSTVFNLAGR